MALIDCPECGAKRSNQAWYCPSCGGADLERIGQDLMGLSVKVFLLLLLVGLLLVFAAAIAPALLSNLVGAESQ